MQTMLTTQTMSTNSSSTTDQPTLKAWHYRAISLTIILAVSLFLGLSIWVGWDKMSEAVSRIGIIGFCIALSLTLANLAVRLLRWQLYLNELEIKVPLIKSSRIYIGGLALSATPGKAGEIIRGVFLKQYGATYMKSFAMFISDRFTDLVAVLILATTALWTNIEARPIAVLLAGIILLVMLSVQFPHYYKRIITKLSSYIYWNGLTNLLLKTIDIVEHCKALFRFPVFLAAITIALIAWSFEGLNLYIIAHLLQAEIAFTTVLSIYAFSKLIGAISMIPGGMGTTEATLVGLFIYNGVDESTAITCALFLRLTTFWFVTTLGLIALPSHADSQAVLSCR
jgi:uncharacterized protein (TIRG00374 family)